jgi:hypothetical protein
MPNFDAGHYFLTAAMPVRMDSILIDGQSHSRRHLIREALSAMPMGERTEASEGKGNASPFARSRGTHFVRLFVLDDVVFNGRMPRNTLVDKLRKTDMLKPQPVDRLSTPFLFFNVDFDAENGTDRERDLYLTDLWQVASEALTRVFQHCQGFDAVHSAQDFCRYIGRCQLETTMPFNDYWSTPPALHDTDLVPYAIGGGAAILVGLVGLAIHVHWLSLVALLALIAAIWLAYHKVMEVGRSPFPKSAPPAPQPDLPTVLKALYLQRAFTEFAIDMQGESDKILFDRFGAFIAEKRPDDMSSPTQEPGVIGA